MNLFQQPLFYEDVASDGKTIFKEFLSLSGEIHYVLCLIFKEIESNI